MRILISTIAIKDRPTGVFSRGFNLAKGLVKLGNQVTFLTTQDKGFNFPYSKEVRDGVLIIAVPSFFSFKIKKFGYDFMPILLKTFYILFKNYDIVHSDLYRPSSLLPCIIHRFFHKSLLISDWQDINGRTGLYNSKSKIWKWTIGPFDNWLELYSKKISDGIIALSEPLKLKTKNLNISKAYKLWGGSDLDKIKFCKSSLTNRKFFNLSKDDFVIVFIGLAMTDYEDNLSVFKAIQKSKNTGINITVVRTGKRYSEAFKAKHNIGNEILDLGYVDDRVYGKLLSCADACMLVQKENNNN